MIWMGIIFIQRFSSIAFFHLSLPCILVYSLWIHLSEKYNPHGTHSTIFSYSAKRSFTSVSDAFWYLEAGSLSLSASLPPSCKSLNHSLFPSSTLHRDRERGYKMKMKLLVWLFFIVSAQTILILAVECFSDPSISTHKTAGEKVRGRDIFPLHPFIANH